MGKRADDVYILVDLTSPSITTMLGESTTRHRTYAPETNLSVVKNIAGDRAIVKVRGGRNWATSWINDAFVLRVYTAAEHDLVKALVRSPELEPSI